MSTVIHIFKKLAVIATFFAPLSTMAQNKLFEQLSTLEEVQYTYVSSDMISSVEDVLSVSTPDILSQLNSVEILTSDDNDISYVKIRDSIKSLSDKMTLLSRVKDDSETTQIFGTKSPNMPARYSSILYIQDDSDLKEITLIYLEGRIEPDAIRKLVD